LKTIRSFEKVSKKLGVAMAVVIFIEQGRKKEIDEVVFANLTVDDWIKVFNESSADSEVERMSLGMVRRMINGGVKERLGQWLIIHPLWNSFNSPKIADVAHEEIGSILKANVSVFSFEEWIGIDRRFNRAGGVISEFVKAQIVCTAKTFEQQIEAYNVGAFDWRSNEEEDFIKRAGKTGWVELYKKYSIGSGIRGLAFENLPNVLNSEDFNVWLDICETHSKEEWDRGVIGSGKRRSSENEQKFFSEKLHKTANTFEQWEKVEELFRISQAAFDKMLEKASSFNHWHKIYKVLKSVASYKYDDYRLRNPKISELEVLAKMAKKAKTLEQWGIILDGAQEGQLWEKARKEIERMCDKLV